MSDHMLMKAQKWRDHKHKMTYPAWAELKVDEIRCHVIVSPDNASVQYLSYAGKPLHNLQYFDDNWIALAEASGWHEFDTGFEANGTFADSYRWVRSSKGLPKEYSVEETRVKFVLFDLPELAGEPFEKRSTYRHNCILLGMSVDFNALYPTTGTWVHSEEMVDTLFERARRDGHEGLMVKSTIHEYIRGTRSYGWLKVKPEDDADGVITEIIEAVSERGEPLGRAGSVRVQVEDGSTAAPSGIVHALGTEMFEHPEKFIGQWVEFCYMERDRAGGYRHPIFHRLREAKK